MSPWLTWTRNFHRPPYQLSQSSLTVSLQTSANWGPNSRFILEVVFKPLIHCKSRLWCVNLNTQIMTIDLRQVLTQVIFELASFWRIAIAGRVIHRNLCHCTFLQSNSFVLVRMSQFIFRFLHKVFNLKL